MCECECGRWEVVESMYREYAQGEVCTGGTRLQFRKHANVTALVVPLCQRTPAIDLRNLQSNFQGHPPGIYAHIGLVISMSGHRCHAFHLCGAMHRDTRQAGQIGWMWKGTWAISQLGPESQWYGHWASAWVSCSELRVTHRFVWLLDEHGWSPEISVGF